MEEIDYSTLFWWFVGMNLDEPVWDVTVFTKNRNRLLDGEGDECDTARCAEHEAKRRESDDQRTTRHRRYSVSQKKRKRIEECFGWLKTIAMVRKYGIEASRRWVAYSRSQRRTTW